jgi:hypothetical protein
MSQRAFKPRFLDCHRVDFAQVLNHNDRHICSLYLIFSKVCIYLAIASSVPEIQPELLKIQNVTTEELLVIARSKVEPSQHERHVELLEKNQEGSLTPEERQELTDLRVAADCLMLRKAYAWSVLRWRGHRIPRLKELAASV